MMANSLQEAMRDFHLEWRLIVQKALLTLTRAPPPHFQSDSPPQKQTKSRIQNLKIGES